MENNAPNIKLTIFFPSSVFTLDFKSDIFQLNASLAMIIRILISLENLPSLVDILPKVDDYIVNERPIEIQLYPISSNGTTVKPGSKDNSNL